MLLTLFYTQSVKNVGGGVYSMAKSQKVVVLGGFPGFALTSTSQRVFVAKIAMCEESLYIFEFCGSSSQNKLFKTRKILC